MFRIMVFFLFLLLAPATVSWADDPARVVTNIEGWRHPTKKVFQKYKVTLLRVEITDNGKYPTFSVKLPYDPQSSQNERYYNTFYLELLRANGWWSYSLDDGEDGVIIKIAWDNKGKTMQKEYVAKDSH